MGASQFECRCRVVCLALAAALSALIASCAGQTPRGATADRADEALSTPLQIDRRPVVADAGDVVDAAPRAGVHAGGEFGRAGNADSGATSDPMAERRAMGVEVSWEAITLEMVDYYSAWYATVRVANRARTRVTERWSLLTGAATRSLTLPLLARAEVGEVRVSIGLIGKVDGDDIHHVAAFDAPHVAAAWDEQRPLTVDVPAPKVTGSIKLDLTITDREGVPCAGMPVQLAIETRAGARFRVPITLDDNGAAMIAELPHGTCTVLAPGYPDTRFRLPGTEWDAGALFALNGDTSKHVYWDTQPNVVIRWDEPLYATVRITTAAAPTHSRATQVTMGASAGVPLPTWPTSGPCEVTVFGALPDEQARARYYVGQASFEGRPTEPVLVELEVVPCVPVMVLTGVGEMPIPSAGVVLALATSATTVTAMTTDAAGVVLVPVLPAWFDETVVTASYDAFEVESTTKSLRSAIESGYLKITNVGPMDLRRATDVHPLPSRVDVEAIRAIAGRFSALIEARADASVFKLLERETDAAIKSIGDDQLSRSLGLALAELNRWRRARE